MHLFSAAYYVNTYIYAPTRRTDGWEKADNCSNVPWKRRAEPEPELATHRSARENLVPVNQGTREDAYNSLHAPAVQLLTFASFLTNLAPIGSQ